MIFSAKKEPFNFYTEFLRCGGFIEVGVINNKWIRVTDLEILKRFYEADCLFRIPLSKEQSTICDSNSYSDLSDKEKVQLQMIRKN